MLLAAEKGDGKESWSDMLPSSSPLGDSRLPTPQGGKEEMVEGEGEREREREREEGGNKGRVR